MDWRFLKNRSPAFRFTTQDISDKRMTVIHAGLANPVLNEATFHALMNNSRFF